MKFIPISGAFQVPEGIDEDKLNELLLEWTRAHGFGFIGVFTGGQIQVDQSEFGIRINTGHHVVPLRSFTKPDGTPLDYPHFMRVPVDDESSHIPGPLRELPSSEQKP